MIPRFRLNETLVDTIRVNTHSYDLIECYSELNYKTTCQLFIYEQTSSLNSGKAFMIYNDTPYNETDCTRIDNLINITQFDTVDGWINPVKFSINLEKGLPDMSELNTNESNKQ